MIDSGEPTPKGIAEWIFSIDGEYKMVDPERLDEAAQNAQIIIANDDHPSSFMHTDWVELVRRLHQGGQNPSMLFEMIRDDHQDGLTRFAQGGMSEAEFRTQVYDQSWDWDYRRYQPYFQLIRDLQLHSVAADLNSVAQQQYSNEDKPIQTYAGVSHVSPRAHERDLRMTAAIEAERTAGLKPFLLVGGAHTKNQVKLLTEQHGIEPGKILLLSEYVDGKNTQGFIEFKPKPGHPVVIDRLRPPEPRRASF